MWWLNAAGQLAIMAGGLAVMVGWWAALPS